MPTKMPTLKELNLKFKDVKEVVTSLNAAGVLDASLVLVGVKGEELLTNFVVAMNAISDDAIKGLDENVRTFYNALPDSVFDAIPEDTDLPEEAIEVAADEPDTAHEAFTEDADAIALRNAQKFEAQCPTFGKQNLAENDCQVCAGDFPDEHDACTVVSKAQTKAKPKPKSSGTSGVGKLRTRYGHTPGTMSGDIDDMVFLGMPIKDMAQKIAKKHNRTIEKAQAKIRVHVGHIVANRSDNDGNAIAVSDTDGYLKCDIEFARGFTTENTQVSFKGNAIPKSVAGDTEGTETVQAGATA